jgi:hypothetical protein
MSLDNLYFVVIHLTQETRASDLDHLNLQALRKDPDLEGNLVMAQKYNSGWLPRALLAKSKFVSRWYKERAKQPHGVMHICKTLIPLLQAELADMPGEKHDQSRIPSISAMVGSHQDFTFPFHLPLSAPEFAMPKRIVSLDTGCTSAR